MSTRCFGCMKIKQNHPVCEHCGFDERRGNCGSQLPAGTWIGEQYILGRALSQDQNTICYIALDVILDTPVILAEFYPQNQVVRTEDGIAVQCIDKGSKASWGQLLKKILSEDSRSECIKANGTVYQVRVGRKPFAPVWHNLPVPELSGMPAADVPKRKRGVWIVVAALTAVFAMAVLISGFVKKEDIPPAATEGILAAQTEVPFPAEAEEVDTPETDAVMISTSPKETTPETTPETAPYEETIPEQPSSPFEYRTNETGLTITGYNGSVPKTLILPDQIDGIPVTAVGNMAFFKCDNISEVIIPDGVVSIGWSTFEECRNLLSITIPDSVASIDRAAFAETPWLELTEEEFVICGDGVLVKYKGSNKNVTIPSTVKYISDAFSRCETMTNITIPSSVTSIGDGAFSFCSNLSGISIPNSVVSVGEQAFFGCQKLGWVSFPNTLQSIGFQAFYGCNGLTQVTLPNSDLHMEGGVFMDCSGLTRVTIPGAVTTIGNGAFESCQNLQTVTLAEGTSIIDDTAFRDCPKLTRIQIPKSVTYIGGYAFDGCTSLSSVALPQSVQYIESYAFTETPWLENQKDEFVIAGNGVLIQYNGTETNIVIPSSVKVIACLFDRQEITDIQIPESVTAIGNNVFSDCSGLSEISIPDSVVSIGAGTFSGCSGLKEVRIPDSVSSIGTQAFSGCSSLTHVVLPSGLTVLEDSVFNECTALTEVVIPDSVVSIKRCAFLNCNALTSITIPASVTELDTEIFDGCGRLANVTFACSPETIPASTFYGCSSLTALVIPPSVKSIEWNAFGGCTNLETITVPRTLDKASFENIPDGCTILYH